MSMKKELFVHKTAAYNSIDVTYYQQFNAAGTFKIGIGLALALLNI